jgi:hypothetical protein
LHSLSPILGQGLKICIYVNLMSDSSNFHRNHRRVMIFFSMCISIFFYVYSLKIIQSFVHYL